MRRETNNNNNNNKQVKNRRWLNFPGRHASSVVTFCLLFFPPVSLSLPPSLRERVAIFIFGKSRTFAKDV